MKVNATSHCLPYPQPHGGDRLLASGEKCGKRTQAGRRARGPPGHEPGRDQGGLGDLGGCARVWSMLGEGAWGGGGLHTLLLLLLMSELGTASPCPFCPLSQGGARCLNWGNGVPQQ